MTPAMTTAPMMTMPLLISHVIEQAARHNADVEVVSRQLDGSLHRTTYGAIEPRMRQLASAFEQRGLALGQRVGTLAWNGFRHLELYYAVGGAGAVIHTINPRLLPQQIAWIVNHAEDRFLAFDLSFLPIVEAIAPHCPQVEAWIALCEPEHMPSSQLKLVNYEQFLATGTTAWQWPELDENTPSGLCYTSGTTGNPKGVMYTHRSTVLHAFAASMPDGMALSARDVIAPVVPMFHVNAWGLPYAVPLVGAKLVLPGAQLDGKSLFELFEQEKVTCSAGVPTIWQGLLAYMRQNQLRFSSLRRTVVGGAACPPALMKAFEAELGASIVHAWGMTEMSPLGTVSRLRSQHLDLDSAAQDQILFSQGHVLYGVDMKIVDDNNHDLPWDGHSFGNLLVRGPWILNRYFKLEQDNPLVLDERGREWMPTGDVATISPDGFMRITDRSKDVIKSGGEWISSIELENLAMAHPAVAMAAVIGLHHPKWDERPLLIVVRAPQKELSASELLAFFEGKVARWWIPEDVQFVESIPLGATGKILKTKLREQFAAYQFPSAS